MDERGRDKVKSQRGRDTREKRDRETTEWGRKLRNIRNRQRGRQMEPERRESRSVSDAWARWMIIDPLCRQLERSVSDSTGQHHVERREEGQAEMFPLLFQRVTISLLHSCTLLSFLSTYMSENSGEPHLIWTAVFVVFTITWDIWSHLK